MGAKRKAKKEFAKEQELAKLRAKHAGRANKAELKAIGERTRARQAAVTTPSPSRHVLSPEAQRRNAEALQRSRQPTPHAPPPPPPIVREGGRLSCPDCDFVTAYRGLYGDHRHKVHGDAAPTAAAEARRAQQLRAGGGDPSAPAGCLIAVVLAAIVLIGGIILATRDPGSGSGSTSPSEQAEEAPAEAATEDPPVEADPALAFEMCKEFVKERLKAPSTASFRNYYEDDGEVQVRVDGAEVTILSTVDSENSFGAELRTAFVCTVRDEGEDQWRLVDLQIDG